MSYPNDIPDLKTDFDPDLSSKAQSLALNLNKTNNAVIEIAETLDVNPSNPSPASPASTASTVKALLGQFKQAIADIQGSTHWYDNPAVSLNDVDSHLDDNDTDIGLLQGDMSTAQTNITNLTTGWIPFAHTLTFGTSDIAAGGATSTNGVSTYTATVSGDYSAVLCPGMKIKLTNTTVKYFIVTAVVFATGTTTITMYGGTDYALVSAAITSVYYALPKTAPIGFPLDPKKWTVEMVDTSSAVQSTPTANTWYNPSTLSITVPVGSFDAYYEGTLAGTKTSATSYNMWGTLSTANNSESDPELSTLAVFNGASGTIGGYMTVFRQKPLTVTTKTQYFLNARTTTSGGGVNVGFDGSIVRTIIRLRCAYL